MYMHSTCNFFLKIIGCVHPCPHTASAHGERLDDWLKLVSLVVPFNLNENKDRFLAVEEMVNFLLNLYVLIS
jgi:hypothetical protein